MKLINLLFFLICSSCVSVQLQKPVVFKKSKAYSLAVPQSPFVASEQAGLDQYWRNPNNTNSISLQTACSERYDPSLSELTYQSVHGIEEASKVSEERFKYNERAALRSKYKGFVDGIPVVIELVTLKKNNCSYVISYFGREKNISVDQQKFETFLRNFRVR